MKTGLRLDEYIKVLLEKRKLETRKKDPIYESGEELTSPTGANSTEETRIFNEYMEQANLLKIAGALPEQRKTLMLKRFFKMKRNQQVTVYSKCGKDTVYTLGKVSAVGRDFVMLTNLKDRIWLPYQFIASANIPAGIPNYSNSHQYFIYDNDLKRKLLTNFGEAVSKRDALVQQFYEESLFTNLRSWKGTWVKVRNADEELYGRIEGADKNSLSLSLLRERKEVLLTSITHIHSIRFFSLLVLLGKKLFLRL